MFKKKAQGLTLNTVIIAILVLLVLVVLSLLFFRTTSSVSAEIKECQNRGGNCVDQNLCDPINDRIISTVVCLGRDGEPKTADDEVCCVKA